ncbi:MAG: helix-turn-helix transcriptional regulator [Bacteroidota bacterium]|nr:helix-turn-helix transcriptional regulator [Bacteroidota bacterium]
MLYGNYVFINQLDMSENEFAARINSLIEKLNHNKKSFGESIDVSQPVITHLCNGRNNPSLDILQKIILNYPMVNPEWLITGNGEIMKNNNEINPYEQIKETLENIDSLIVESNQSMHKAIKLIRQLKSIP